MEEEKTKTNNMIEIAVFDGVFDEDNWRDQARCSGQGTDIFFVEKRGGASVYFDARCVCFSCPVQKNCLDFAVSNSIKDGMWGGLTYRERLKYAKGKRGWKISIFDLVKGLRGPNQTIAVLAEKLGITEEMVRNEIRNGRKRKGFKKK